MYYRTHVLIRDNDTKIIKYSLSQEQLRRMLANYNVSLNIPSMCTCYITIHTIYHNYAYVSTQYSTYCLLNGPYNYIYIKG